MQTIANNSALLQVSKQVRNSCSFCVFQQQHISYISNILWHCPGRRQLKLLTCIAMPWSPKGHERPQKHDWVCDHAHGSRALATEEAKHGIPYLEFKDNALLSTPNQWRQAWQKFMAMARTLAKTVATSIAKILRWQTRRQRQWQVAWQKAVEGKPVGKSWWQVAWQSVCWWQVARQEIRSIFGKIRAAFCHATCHYLCRCVCQRSVFAMLVAAVFAIFCQRSCHCQQSLPS